MRHSDTRHADTCRTVALALHELLTALSNRSLSQLAYFVKSWLNTKYGQRSLVESHLRGVVKAVRYREPLATAVRDSR